jgi:DNA-binding transcriptional MocR family regulator
MYANVMRTLQSHIRVGVYKPGARLPSEKTLAAQFGVARATVQRALREMRRGGWIRSEHGRGHFVIGRPVAELGAAPTPPTVLGWVRPPVMLVEPTEWAAGALWRLFLAHVPLGLLDPLAQLQPARADAEVYEAALLGCGVPAEVAADQAAVLADGIDRVLGALVEALDGPPPPVVPQLRADWADNILGAAILDSLPRTGS